MQRGETRPLTGQRTPAQRVGAQRQLPVSPCDSGPRTLTPLRALCGPLSQGTLGLGTPRTPGASRRTQGGAPAVSERPQRRARTDGARVGHTIESRGGQAAGGPGAGGRRWHGPWTDVWPPITGATRDGRRQVRHDPLGGRAAIAAPRAARCVLRHGAPRLSGRPASGGEAVAVSPAPTRTGDPVRGRAHGGEALAALRAVPAQPRVRLAGRVAGPRGVSRRLGAVGGRPGPRGVGGAPVLSRRAGPCASGSGAAGSAWSAARSWGARGAPTAVRRAGWPGNPSGAGGAPRGGATAAPRPGAASRVAGLPAPVRCGQAGALRACQTSGARAGARGATRLQGLTGSGAPRHRPPVQVVVWRHGEGVAGQVVGPAGGGGVAGGDERVCPLSGDRLLRSRGGGDTAVPPGAGAQQTDHPPAASAPRDTAQRAGANAPMEQGASRAMVQQLGHLGTPIARGMPCMPRVQGGARPLQLLGGVTRGEAWRWPVARWLAPIGPRAAGPAWRAVDRVAGGKAMTVLLAPALARQCQAAEKDEGDAWGGRSPMAPWRCDDSPGC